MTETPVDAPAPGCLRLLLRGLFGLVTGVLRVGVVLAVYAAAAIAGGLFTMNGMNVDVLRRGESLLFNTNLGAVILPFALTVGFAAWLFPASYRLVTRREEDLDANDRWLVPRRAEYLILVTVTVSIAAGCGGVLSTDGAAWMTWAFAVSALVATLILVGSGARQIGALWLVMLLGVLGSN